jgi:hypothetical protein
MMLKYDERSHMQQEIHACIERHKRCNNITFCDVLVSGAHRRERESMEEYGCNIWFHLP